MPKVFLGIDVGTSGTKALLLTADGAVQATATASHPIYFPHPGWSEQQPDEWWASTRKAVRAVLGKGRVSGSDVAGIGLSGQMHGSVFLDAQGKPVHNALLWNDQRTGAECAEIERSLGGRRQLIGAACNIALTGYTAPKILWLRRHQPRAFKKVRQIVLPKDYINYRLTGALRSDVSDAAGTLLLDIRKRDWSDKLLSRLKLDRELFAEVAESSEVIGVTTKAAAKALGLVPDIPVVAGAGDQPAAAVGTGVVKRGIVSATMGTSGVVFAYSDKPVANRAGLLQSFCHAVPDAWCVFGCMLSAGGSLQWAREVFYADRLHSAKGEAQQDRIYTDMIAEAARIADDEPLIFHPYLTGERCPYPHPHARGAFLNVERRHGRAALVHAVLEGITFGMGQQVDILRQLEIPVREVRLAGGGARNAWWRQLQADTYGVKCSVMKSEEGSAMGAAILAAVGGGAFKSVPAACQAAAQVKASLKPNRQRHKRLAEKQAIAAAYYEFLEPEYRVQAEA